MKIKNLVLLSTLCLLFACGGGSNPTSQEISSEAPISSEAEVQSDFDFFRSAITFETNDAYTGYSLSESIMHKSSKEEISYKNTLVRIDNVSGALEYTSSHEHINTDINSDGEKITETTHMYYTNGSIIVQGDDGRYTEKDGIITKSSGLPKINPKEEHFTSLELNKVGNTLDMEGVIDPSKANELFSATGLENISNCTMEASLYDDRLEEVIWTYDQEEINVYVKLTIYYNDFVITPPAL